MPLIAEGKKAPAFALEDQDGKTHRLKDYAGRPVVLYFYPKDDTPGCTTEACAFRDAHPDFSKVKAVVLGVSVLDTTSKAKFAKKHSLNFPLLADADHAIAETYGAWQEKSMYGRKYMGVARITYLVGPDGKVLKRWDKVSPSTHADEVLGQIQLL
ncbi:MAG: thioredoxin-dependent thiol peroxidase [Vicinamibacteria bacterium]|nr:thioredoxin-dependent thiol peroxidase [Vicinamibacteria bacterium]